MENLILNVEPREVFGKKVKSLRKKGQIPAILYGRGIKSIPLSVDSLEFEKVFEKAGASTLVDLKVNKGGAKEKSNKVLIHEPQRDPITLKPIHIDLYQVKMTEKITTEIPLKFSGEAPAVRELDGTLITNRDTIEVQCLPDALVHEIEVDVSNLKTFEDLIKISDLKIPQGIEVLNDPEETVVSITPPRTEEELAELEAPVEEKVEEVEEVKPAEEEEVAEEEVEEPEKIPESGQEQTQEQKK